MTSACSRFLGGRPDSMLPRLAVPFPGGAPMIFGLPNRPFTVLVIGLDRRPTDTGPSRTDTILVLRIDPRSHHASFLSIPRDSMMQIPNAAGGYDRDRINTAYVYNYSSKDESAAPRALMTTIEHNLGIKIDHYVTFDQYSAESLINAMGGVTIDNPREFGQSDYSDDDVHVVPQHFAKGQLDLDGYQAVAYGRIREGSSDFDRIQRQQRVGAALIDDAASPFSIFTTKGKSTCSSLSMCGTSSAVSSAISRSTTSSSGWFSPCAWRTFSASFCSVCSACRV